MDSNGHLDVEKVAVHMNMTLNKYRQNLINLERNIGKSAFNTGATINPLRDVNPSGLKRRQSEALADVGNDIEWVGVASVGTPSQNFLIDFDTGSSDFWVPVAQCQTCSQKNIFNPSASSTNAPQRGNFSIQYGDGSSASGSIFTDTVNIANLTANNVTFSGASQVTGGLIQSAQDGILGLGFPPLSQLRANNFFTDAFQQKQVSQNAFSFKLAQQNSSLFFGGADSTLFTGPTEFHNLSSSMGFWQIGPASIKANNQTARSGFDTVIDSGTTLIIGPPQDVSAFYALVPGATQVDAQNGFFAFPCNTTLPTIAFNWGGLDWVVSSANFNLGPIQQGSSQCMGAIIGVDPGLGRDVWVLGDSFMKNVYTTFSVGQNAVGFSQLAATPSAPAPSAPVPTFVPAPSTVPASSAPVSPASTDSSASVPASTDSTAPVLPASTDSSVPVLPTSTDPSAPTPSSGSSSSSGSGTEF